jgi:hypothetical protein
LNFESANAPLIVAGLNTTARPNIELALSKLRRDLSSGSFIGCSFRVVLRFFHGVSSSSGGAFLAQDSGAVPRPSEMRWIPYGQNIPSR